MRFGLGPYELGSYWGESHLNVYEEMLEQGELAEEQGFDSVWIAERHFTPEGACPSPETAAAALAVRTEAVRIGLITSITLTNPLYVAEDVAVVDCIANGRVIVVPEPGRRRAEVSGYNAGTDDAQARYAEALEVILKSWAPTAFAHDGRNWRLPGRDFRGNPFAEGVTEINVTPKPAQLNVPVWIPGHDRAAVDWAARKGFPWLGSPFDTLAQLKEKQEAYGRILASAGRETQGLLFPVLREVYVGETDQEARADVEEGLLALYGSYRKWGILPDAPASFDALAKDRFIIGDVDHVIGEIERYRSEAGVNYLICRTVFPGLSHAKAMSAIKFLGQSVIPEFRMASFPREIRRRTRA